MNDPASGAKMVVGFVGLGTMGLPMCRRLADCGFEMLAYDIDWKVRSQAVEDAGIDPVETVTELAAAAIVVTMLPDGDSVRRVLIDEGLADGLPDEAIVIECSSSDPAVTKWTAGVLATHRVGMIDAPVSGNPSRARNGSLTLIVGGEEHLVRRASPVLEALGTIHRVGGLGSGHTLKALNNLLASINLAASAEIMLVGRRLGLETEIMLSTLNACTGRNDATENKIGQFVLPRSFDSGFRLALMRKDISNALELASRTGSPCDFGQVCDRLWGAALDELGPSADNLQVLRLMERAAHAELA